MSALLPNFSKFYYGFKVNAEPYNGYIDLDEGSGEISVEVPVGTYTLSELVTVVRQALLDQATLDYTVSVDRSSRFITISATSPFELLTFSGAHSGTSIFSLLGFNVLADTPSATSHTSVSPAGKAYHPQFLLQSYIGPDDWQQKNEAQVNVSSSGTSVEVVNFGIAKFAQFDIKFITNKSMDGVVIQNNPSGLDDARDFLRYITEKNYFEFIPNVSDVNTYYKVLCESMPDFQDGTGYKLKELWDKGLPGIFETGIINVRVLE